MRDRSIVRIAIVLVLATMLRVLALGKPLYIDEIVSITVAAQPLVEMPSVMRQIDATPVLSPLLLHVWMILGRSDVWVRLLPALFGIAAVVVVYLIGRRLFDEPTGAWAAFVAAIAPAHVHYAQYVRNYSLFTLLAGLHLLVFIRMMGLGSAGCKERQQCRGAAAPRPDPGMDRDSSFGRSRFIVMVVLTATLLYTHYLSLLLFISEALFVLWRWRRARLQVIRWAAATVLGGVLFLPGVPLLLHNAAFDRLRNEDRPRPPSPVVLLPNLISELTLGQRALGFRDPTVRRSVLAAAAIVFPAVLAVGIVAGWRQHRDAVVLLLLIASAPVLIYVGSGRRLVAVRFFLPFMLGYIVMLGHGLSVLRSPVKRMAAGCVAILCAVPLIHFYRDFQWSYDHRAVAQAIDGRDAPGDVLLVVHPYEAFYYRWYLGSAMPIEGLTFTALKEQGGYVLKPAALRVEAAQRRVTDVLRTHRRFWIVGQSRRSFASDADAERQLLGWMDATFTRLEDLGWLTGGDPAVRLYAPVGRE